MQCSLGLFEAQRRSSRSKELGQLRVGSRQSGNSNYYYYVNLVFVTLAGFAINALTSNPTVSYDGTNFPSLTKDLASSPSFDP